MIVFRCSRCCKVNISTEGYICLHCGNEEARVSSIPENQTEITSSINDNDVCQHMQNKSAVTDLNVLPQVSAELNVPKLHIIDGKAKDNITVKANCSEISTLQGEPIRPIKQIFIRKEILISPDKSSCSNSIDMGTSHYPSTKSDTSAPTKTLQPISKQLSLRKYKKKTFKRIENAKCKQNKNTFKKFNLENSCHFSKGNSVTDLFTKDDDNANQLKDNREKTDYSRKQLRKRSNLTINNSFKEVLKSTNAFLQQSAGSSQEVSSKGCSKNVNNEKMLIKSIKVPISEKLFLCNECGKTFTTQSKLEVHFRNHFKEKLFKCDRCDKEYSSEVHLKRHYNSHMDKGPFKCDLCDLVFIRNCHLSRHLKKHILEPTVDVNTAQREVDLSSQQKGQNISKDQLLECVKTTAEEKIFHCKECDARFIRESDFDAHSLRHSVQKPFKCNQCNKDFSYEVYLKSHYRTHTLERPFTCKICGFKSIQISHLNTHLKTHV